MASERDILLEIKVNAGETAVKLAETRQQLDALKQSNKDAQAQIRALNREMSENGSLTAEQAATYKTLTSAVAENNANIKQLTATEKMYSSQINIVTQGNRRYGDSITEMSAHLAQLKNEYRGLSATQREGTAGKRLLEQIQNMDKEIKSLDSSLGDHQRNVGNYQSALYGLNGNMVQVVGLFQNGFRNGLTAAGTSLKAFGKTLLATPIGWLSTALRVLVRIFGELTAAFMMNDDAGTEMSATMQRLRPVVTMLREAFQAIAGAVASFVGNITKAATAVLNFLVPSFREASKAAEDLVRAQDRLEDMEREYTVAQAERANQRAKLEEKARYDANLTAEERVKMLEASKRLSEQDLKDKRDILKERLRQLEEEAANEKDFSDEMKNRIAEARAAYINSETEMIQGTRRLNSQLKSAREELQKEDEERKRRAQEAARAAKAAREEAARAAAERRKTEDEELRKLEDLQVELMENEAERARRGVEIGYDRQMEDLRKRLDEEKNLTAEAREAMEQQLVLIEQQKNRELAMLDEERLKAARETERKMAEETAKMAEETARKLKEEQAERIQQLIDDYDRQALAYAISVQERLNEVYGNAVAAAQIEEEAQRTRLQNLLTMDAETKAAMFTNEEAYKAAVLDAEKEMQDAQEKTQQAMASQAKEVGQTMQAVTGALSDMFEAAAGDSEQYEKFKKAMAIVDAVISMATTIAAATSASTAGDPYTMAIRIAANVAAVTAQFAAVIKSIKAAQIPSAGKYAEGGIVPGNSWTGDKVPAYLNSGEMVLNMEAQRNLLKMIVDGAPMMGGSYKALAAAVAEGVAALPAPVLNYSEFTRFQREVRMMDNLSESL